MLFHSRNGSIKDKRIPAIWKIVLFAVIMAPISCLGLYVQNHLGDNFLGFHDLKYFPTYIVMFYFGIQAFKYKWFDQLELKHAFWGILMWLFGWGLSALIGIGYSSNFYVIGRGFTVIGMSMFLIYVFKAMFDKKNKWTAILSRSAFAAYVIQNIPQAFIAGIYGTNFEYVPELTYKYSYFIMWIVMIIVAIGMLLFFTKKKWF